MLPEGWEASKPGDLMREWKTRTVAQSTIRFRKSAGTYGWHRDAPIRRLRRLTLLGLAPNVTFGSGVGTGRRGCGVRNRGARHPDHESRERGMITVLGKGGRMRTLDISLDLYRRLEARFQRSHSPTLASLRAYQVALSRATLAVGGRVTGSHTHRRAAALDFYSDRYHHYRAQGLTPADARRRAVEDAVDRLGHSRNRKDVAAAYLSRKGA